MSKITKAILTGGGRATRLRPITTTINKHLIPLANKPMIFHAIEKAVEAGITDIFINTNPEETELQKAVGDGSGWGIKIKYFIQEGGPQGVAHVVKCAEEFIKDEPFLFYFSDNIILGSLKPLFKEFENKKYDCMLAFAGVPDPERFGVPLFNAEGKLLNIIEKPKNPTNNFAQTGICLYGPKVYFKAFNKVTKSARGEYEISDLHSYLLKNGSNVGWKEITGWWKDTGKPIDLILANKLLLEEMPPEKFTQNTAAGQASIEGKVAVGKGTTFGAHVKLVGPVTIGDNCILDNCTIGPAVTVGQGSTLKNCVVQNSIIFAHCSITSPIKISDSIIGEKAVITTNNQVGFHHLIVGDNTLIEV